MPPPTMLICVASRPQAPGTAPVVRPPSNRILRGLQDAAPKAGVAPGPHHCNPPDVSVTSGRDPVL